MTRILIFPAGTEIGLEVNRSLKDNKHFEVWGGSSADDHARFAFKHYMPEFPYVGDPDFIDLIAHECELMDIDYIYPAHDDVVYQLAKHRDRIPAEVIAPDFETVEVCRSKENTYDTFPEISPARTFDFPMFAKPDRGQGSRGARKIETEAQYKEAVLSPEKMSIREYLPGPEYTVDCFTDRHGRLRFCSARIRSHIKGGISVRTMRINHPPLYKMGLNINKRLNMRGGWFFQVKEDANHRMTLMEIAPRIAGSSGLWRANGVNLVELSLWDRMGKDVDFVFSELKTEMSRALSCKYDIGYDIKRVYCDFDDCLLFADNSLNGPLYSFLVDSVSKGREVVILSRDAARYDGLNMPFPIVRIPDRSVCKSTAIDPDGAIFIDDSFAERKRVFEALGIPVFGLDAVECLI